MNFLFQVVPNHSDLLLVGQEVVQGFTAVLFLTDFSLDDITYILKNPSSVLIDLFKEEVVSATVLQYMKSREEIEKSFSKPFSFYRIPSSPAICTMYGQNDPWNPTPAFQKYHAYYVSHSRSKNYFVLKFEFLVSKGIQELERFSYRVNDTTSVSFFPTCAKLSFEPKFDCSGLCENFMQAIFFKTDLSHISVSTTNDQIVNFGKDFNSSSFHWDLTLIDFDLDANMLAGI